MDSLYYEYKNVYDTSMKQIQNLLLIDLKMSTSLQENFIPKEHFNLQAMKFGVGEDSIVDLEVRPMPFKVSPVFVDQVNNLLELAKWAKEKMEKEHILGLRHSTLP